MFGLLNWSPKIGFLLPDTANLRALGSSKHCRGEFFNFCLATFMLVGVVFMVVKLRVRMLDLTVASVMLTEEKDTGKTVL